MQNAIIRSDALRYVKTYDGHTLNFSSHPCALNEEMITQLKSAPKIVHYIASYKGCRIQKKFTGPTNKPKEVKIQTLSYSINPRLAHHTPA